MQKRSAADYVIYTLCGIGALGLVAIGVFFYFVVPRVLFAAPEKAIKEPPRAEITSGEWLVKRADAKRSAVVAHDPTPRIALTLEDSIRDQIMKCWNYPSGASDQGGMQAHILLMLNEDGSLHEAKLKPTQVARYNSDRPFKSLVDSTLRATRNPACFPLKGLPASLHKEWGKLELIFDPAEMW